jgi:uncharacterized DUF497 family protein
MRLEWDPAKSESNDAKHGLSFDDDAHSDDEDRFIAVGPIGRGVIVVVYTERDDEVLRIVSARMATTNERRRYEEHEEAKHRG